MIRRTTALVWMRLSAYVRGQRIFAPHLLALAMLAVVHAGGTSTPAEAYGFSAGLLFGVFAWQTKLVLDAEPDGQRLIAQTAVGGRSRELTAGVAAGVLAGVPVTVLAVLAPAVTGRLDTDAPLGALTLGLWAHAVALCSASAVGALASRAVCRRAGWAAAILVGAAVGVLVLGSRGSGIGPWLVPRVVEIADLGGPSGVLAEVGSTVHAAIWSALLLAAYALLRRRRP